MASDDDNEYDENYEDEGRLDDELLRKLGCSVKSALNTKALSKG